MQENGTTELEQLLYQAKDIIARFEALGEPKQRAMKVLSTLQELPGASRAEIATLLHMEPTAVGKLLAKLAEQNQVICLGRRRAGRWYLASQLDQMTKPKADK